MINIIAAVSKNNVIGDKNSLIWNIPRDMKRFKTLTTGKTVVMGRKTYESIGKLLPNRRNIIITRKSDYNVEGAEVVNSIISALKICSPSEEIFIIGGGEIYNQVISMDIADNIYLTYIDEYFEGDTNFPLIGDKYVRCLKRDYHENGLSYSFINYVKLNEKVTY